MIIRPSRLWIATTIIEFDCRLKLKKKIDIWHIPKEEKETKFLIFNLINYVNKKWALVSKICENVAYT